MAFPVIESSSGWTGGTTAATSHAVPLPATVSAGALLLAVVYTPNTGGGTSTIGWPAGWTEVLEAKNTSFASLAWAYKNTAAAGTEDGTTITVTHDSTKIAAVTLSITGAANPSVTPPESGTRATGSTSTINPGATTPTGGAKDYLWLATVAIDGEPVMPSASPPSGYTDVANSTTGTVGSASFNGAVAITQRNLNAASEDPGNWTLVFSSSDWSAWTIAVHPAGAAAPTFIPQIVIVS